MKAREFQDLVFSSEPFVERDVIVISGGVMFDILNADEIVNKFKAREVSKSKLNDYFQEYMKLNSDGAGKLSKAINDRIKGMRVID